MKNKSKLILLLTLLVTAFFSCTKDEHQIYFLGGTAPKLTADQTELVLTHDDASKDAVTFSWTNPNYQFTTGVSSQDVAYILQVDTVGGDFLSANMQEVSISKDLGITYNEKDLNAILTKLNLTENVAYNVIFRIKATLINNSVPLFSNIDTINITPYLDVAVPIPPTNELYITGDGTPSGWTNAPPDGQKFTQVSNTEYYIVMDFTPGFQYKFLSTPGYWQPQYGISKLPGASGDATGGDLGYNFGPQGDPDGIPTPAVGGTYKVDVNFKTGRYTVVKQ